MASEISKHYQIPTGIIRQGETTVHGGFNGFTMNVSAYVGSSVTQPTAIVLKGFPELESDGGDGGDEGDSYSGTCQVKMGSCSGGSCTATSNYVAPTCPSGYVERDRWTMCSGAVQFRNTPVGASLTIAPDQEFRAGGMCKDSCAGYPSNITCDGRGQTYYYDVVYLNASEIANGNGTPPSQCSRTLTGNYNWSLPSQPCGAFSYDYPGVDEAAVRGGTTAQAILCCTN
ncbi:MAG: hypothetical protein IPO08_16685 [Xanthomonadales bacterium]|nr:hypothetical protein [Xanthomonadales bacterium]